MKAIYQIRNIQTNKIYIGSSIDVENRKYKHFYLLENNKHHSIHLQNSYNKHGKDNFLFEIIEEIKDGRDIIKLEQYYLDILLQASDATDDFHELGYNIVRVAGTNSKGCEIYKYSLEGNYICRYNTIKEAALLHNVTNSCIRAALNNIENRKSAAGFQWKYANDSKEIKNIAKYYVKMDDKGNYVDFYYTLTDAAKDVSEVNKSNINRACKNNTKCRGFYWKIINKQKDFIRINIGDFR